MVPKRLNYSKIWSVICLQVVMHQCYRTEIYFQPKYITLSYISQKKTVTSHRKNLSFLETHFAVLLCLVLLLLNLLHSWCNFSGMPLSSLISISYYGQILHHICIIIWITVLYTLQLRFYNVWVYIHWNFIYVLYQKKRKY